ncbi:MAG: nucleotidyltransferase domain-containing protein [Actinomycetota bacterium]|nr:nucleotidyltransferase domain-containing protein [Actinomycetota bacterium]
MVRWSEDLVRRHPEVVGVGYFGSYATGDWGVGSDVDLVVIVEASEEPFPRRGAAFDATMLPVPADLLAYTEAEWRKLAAERRGPARDRIVWVQRPPADDEADRPPHRPSA